MIATRRSAVSVYLPLLLLVLAPIPAARAATFNWFGGSGNWDTSTANWSGAGSTWPAVSSTNDDAVFGPAAGSVNLTTPITANDIAFATTGYTLAGSTLTLNGTTPTITADVGVTATVAANLAGTVGFTKAGSGHLILRPASAHSITGTSILREGTLTLDYSSMGANASNMLVGTNNLTFHGNKTATASVILKNSVGGGTTTQTFGTIANGRGTSMLLADPAAGTGMVINSSTISLGGTRGWNGSNGTLIIGVMNAAQESQLTFNLTSTTSIDDGGIVNVPVLYTLDGGVDPANLYFAGKSGNVVSRRNADLNVADNFSGVANTHQVRVTTTTTGQSWTNTGTITAQKGLLFVGAHDYSITGGIFGNTPGVGTQNTRAVVISTFGTGTLTISSQIITSNPVGQFSKYGPGTLVLTHAASTYSAATNINGGILSISTLANGGVASSIGQGTNAANQLVLAGATLRYTGATTSTDRLFSVFADSSLDASGSGAVNFTNAGNLNFITNAPLHFTLTGSNTGDNILGGKIIGGATAPVATSVTKSGVGKWVLTNANTYIGTTHVTQGTLALAGAGSIATSASLRIGAGAAFDITALSFPVFTMPSTQLVTFDIDPTAAGSAGLLNASGKILDISLANVQFNILGTLDDAAYIIAQYSGLGGSAFLSATAPTGYALDYNYLGNNQIALVQVGSTAIPSPAAFPAGLALLTVLASRRRQASF